MCFGAASQNHYSIFVATDRHESTSNLYNTTSQAQSYVSANYGVSISKSVHGGDLVNNTNSGQISTFNAEFRSHLTALASDGSDCYYTYGDNHDSNITTDGPNHFLCSAGCSGKTSPTRDSGVVTFGEWAYLWGVDYFEMSSASNAANATEVFTQWVNELPDEDHRAIIIMSHMPLHYRRGDNYGATAWVNAINEAAATKDIIFLWGHNHTNWSSTNDAPYAYVAPGGTITPQSSGSKAGPGGGGSGGSTGDPVTIQFTYMNAGFLKEAKAGWNGSTITIDNNYINIDNFSTSSHYTNRIITRKDPVSTTQYTVTATAEPEAGGTVLGTMTPYYANATCVLQASPYSGYDFSHWTQGDSTVGTDPILSFVITSDTSFVAHFVAVESHTITCNTAQHGSISANKTEAYLYDIVTLSATPDSGYLFSAWDVRDAYDMPVTVTDNWFVMPDSDVTVSATFEESHTITLAAATGGSVSVMPTEAMAGTNITLTAEPDSGYTLGEWIVFKSDDAATRVAVTDNQFVMPAFDVTVAASFTTPTETEVAIGSGTSTSNYLPTDLTKKYSLTEQIYLPSEIGTAGTITTLAFYKSSSDQGARSRSLDVYLKHTSKMEFENTSDWENVSTDDRVFSGTVTVPTAAGWIAITLDTPFEYNGTDNLLVCIDDNSNTTTSRERSFYVYQVDGYLNRAIISRGDTDYDPTNITTQGTTAISNENNQIKFTINLGDNEAPTQNVVLNQGWTWWAPTVALSLDNLKSALDDPSAESLLINAQAKGFVQRNDNEWGGTLDTLLVGQMYKIYSPSSRVFTLTGRQSIALVTLTEGYTWFGYAGAQRTDIATALGSFEPADGDEIISLLGVATYSSDSGWHGAFSQLSPGQGYIYHTAATGTRTIRF